MRSARCGAAVCEGGQRCVPYVRQHHDVGRLLCPLATCVCFERAEAGVTALLRYFITAGDAQCTLRRSCVQAGRGSERAVVAVCTVGQ